MAGDKNVSQTWQLALVIRPFAVRTPSGIQRFQVDQAIEVPTERMKELSRKGLACALLFSPDQPEGYAIRRISHAYPSHYLN